MLIGRVTFAEFLNYIVDMWSSGRLLDRHFRPQHQLCYPCHINYDFIGRFEYLLNDAKLVLANLTGSGRPKWNIAFPTANVYSKNVSFTEMRNSMYARISHNVLSKLLQIYKLDYQLFGYDYQWVFHT